MNLRTILRTWTGWEGSAIGHVAGERRAGGAGPNPAATVAHDDSLLPTCSPVLGSLRAAWDLVSAGPTAGRLEDLRVLCGSVSVSPRRVPEGPWGALGPLLLAEHGKRRQRALWAQSRPCLEVPMTALEDSL